MDDIQNPAIEMSVLRDVTGDDAEGMRYLAVIFLKNARKCFERIDIALESRDAPALRMAAHGGAGSCGSFGAEILSTHFRELEKMGKMGDLTDAPAQTKECKKEFERVVSCLNQLFPDQKAA
jgi:HPt (histidine-containing phosphotransfer) domain-containing protein